MRIGELTVSGFLDSLGAKSPTPGGGAVASVTAALAAALAQMVVNYSQGKKKLAEHDAAHRAALARLEELVRESLDLAEADAEAYGRLNVLWKLDPQDEQRMRDWSGAVQAAIDAPRGVMNACLEMLELLTDLAGKTNRMLDSDLAIAAVLAEAGVRAAAWNVRINLPQLDDEVVAAALADETDRAINTAKSQAQQIESHCRAAP